MVMALSTLHILANRFNYNYFILVRPHQATYLWGRQRDAPTKQIFLQGCAGVLPVKKICILWGNYGGNKFSFFNYVALA